MILQYEMEKVILKFIFPMDVNNYQIISMFQTHTSERKQIPIEQLNLW